MSHSCPKCTASAQNIVRAGHFVRTFDKKRIQRYRCKSCKHKFSAATFHQCYRQKKRHLNPRVLELYVSGVSQRRIAKLLKISRTTVARKFFFVAQVCKLKNQKQFQNLSPLIEVQFDDLVTFEHTKCKPLSVTIFVDRKSRWIVDFEVSQMPANGPLSAISLKKYGPRFDERRQARDFLFSRLKEKILPGAVIFSDKSPHYPPSVRKWFPECFHQTTKGKRGCVTGQGELKKTGYDVLFSLNHSFAMVRANMSRLFRQTWCTTKCRQRLAHHLQMYQWYHNNELI